jgi:hemolysin activation/secretion protein
VLHLSAVSAWIDQRANALPLLLMLATLAGMPALLRAQPSTEADASAAGQPAPIPFDVFEYRVLGNTLLESRDIERLVYPFLGPNRIDADLESARAALEQAYRDAGYFTVLVTLPAQEIDPDAGIVRLQVTEGSVDRLHVTGGRYFSNRRIAKMLPSLQPGEIPSSQDFREDLQRVGARSPDRTLQPVAEAGRQPGTVDFEVQVEDRVPLHLSVEVNDRFTIGTSRPRLSFNASYDNLFQREHSVGVSYQVTPLEDEISAIAFTYRMQPDNSPFTYAFYYLNNDSDIATVTGDLTVGQGETLGFRLSRPLGTKGRFSHFLTAGVDYKDFLDDVDPGGADDSDEDNLLTEINYAVFTARYSGNYIGANPRGLRVVNSFGLELNFGVRGLFNSTPEFDERRFRAEPNFMYVSGDFRRITPLTQRFSLLTRVGGQISGQPLVAQEQFALGGFNTVRGYFLAEQLVDYGFLTSLELRYMPGWLIDSNLLGRLTLHVFGDYGNGGIFDPLPEQQSRVELASLGAGMRAIGGKGRAQIALDWAHALADAALPGVPGADENTAAGDSRLHFSVRYAF